MIQNIVIFTLIAVCHTAELPNYFAKCSKSDPNLEKCLTKSANDAWPSMLKGDKSAHIQKLSPFSIPFLQILINSNLHGNLTDSMVTGMDEVKFESVKMDLDKKMIDIKLTAPVLTCAGNYEAAGKLLLFNIQGKGLCNFTIHGVTNYLHMDFSLKDKGNKKYIHIEKTTLKSDITGGSAYMGSLFGDDERLGDVVNTALNDNWGVVWEEMGTKICEAIANAFGAMLQAFFKKVPFDNFFAD